MSKIPLLQNWYNISNHHTIQNQINNRHTFQQFLNIQTDNKIPNQNTIIMGLQKSPNQKQHQQTTLRTNHPTTIRTKKHNKTRRLPHRRQLRRRTPPTQHPQRKTANKKRQTPKK
jgi:hypothetical protein